VSEDEARSAVAEGPRDAPCHGRRGVNEGGHSVPSSCDGRTKLTALYAVRHNAEKAAKFGVLDEAL